MAQTEVANDVKIEDIGPCLKKITITIPAEKVSEQMESSLAMVSMEAQLPGFRPGRAPKEPTHSVGAASLVLIAHQITDAARFLAFGIGAAYAAAIPAAMGCAAGGTMALGLGALGVVDPRARWIAIGRRIFAVVLLVLGLWLGWQALPD